MKSIVKPTPFVPTWLFFLIALLIFAIPIEHKYDKPFRFYSLTLIPDGLNLPSSFDRLIYFYASDLVALLLLALALFYFRIPLRQILFEKKNACLWILFLSAIASIMISPLSHYPIVYIRLLQLLTPILLFSTLSQFSFTKTHIQGLLFVIICAATLQALFALAQYVTQEPLGLRLLSESRDHPSIFNMEQPRRFLFDNLFGITLPSNIIRRSAGTLPHCNALGGFLMFSIIACYPLWMNTPKRWIKRLITIVLPLQIFALNLTFSRSAIFAFILASIIWFIATSYLFHFRRIQNLFLLVLASTVLTLSILFEQNLARGGILNYGQLARKADLERLSAQKTALSMIQEKPALGVGFQQFSSEAKKKIEPNEKVVGAHNIYLFLWTEMGLFALVGFLLFVGFLLKSITTAAPTPELLALSSILIGFLFIGGCDFYPILFQQGKLMFFIAAALLSMEVRRNAAYPIRP